MKNFEISQRKFFESNLLQNAWAEWNFKQKVRIQHKIWRRILAVILESFLWLEIRFLGPLTKTCWLGSWLLKVFLLLIFVSSQYVLAIKINPVNWSSDTIIKLCWRTHKNLVKRNLLIFPVGFVFSHFIWESLSERKMKPPNPEIFNHENAEIPVLLFILVRLCILPKISSWKVSAGMTFW